MINFKQLFQFSKKEVDSFFNNSKLKSQVRGLRFLQVCRPEQVVPSFGRLLIITPRACGKAHERNQLRRRLKDIFFKNQLHKILVTSIIIANKNSMLLSYEQLQNFLLKNIKEE